MQRAGPCDMGWVLARSHDDGKLHGTGCTGVAPLLRHLTFSVEAHHFSHAEEHTPIKIRGDSERLHPRLAIQLVVYWRWSVMSGPI